MHFKPKHVSNRAYNTECQLSPHVSCSSVTLNPCKSAVVNNPADNVMQPCECTGCDGHIWHMTKTEIWAQQLCCEFKLKQKSHSSISQTNTTINQPSHLLFSISCCPSPSLYLSPTESKAMARQVRVQPKCWDFCECLCTMGLWIHQQCLVVIPILGVLYKNPQQTPTVPAGGTWHLLHWL